MSYHHHTIHPASSSPCETAITNLGQFHANRFSTSIAEEELIDLVQETFDKNFCQPINGKTYTYNDKLNSVKGICVSSNRQYIHTKQYEPEILDTTTFRYTIIYYYESKDAEVLFERKFHDVVTVNPHNGKIVSIKSLAGEAVKEMVLFCQQEAERQWSIKQRQQRQKNPIKRKTDPGTTTQLKNSGGGSRPSLIQLRNGIRKITRSLTR